MLGYKHTQKFSIYCGVLLEVRIPIMYVIDNSFYEENIML